MSYIWIIVFAIILYWLYSLRAKVLPGVYKAPEQYPWIGSLPAIISTFSYHYDYKLRVIRQALRNKSEIVTWSMIASPAYMELCSPRNLEYMLKTNFDNFEKGQNFHDIFFELLGDGIFNVDGEKWRVQRKIASHMFSAKKLNDYMLEVFVNHAEDFVKKLDSVKDFEVIDIQDLFFRYTLDCICEIAFGVKLNCLRDEKKPDFAIAFDAAQEITTFRWFAPKFVWKIKNFLRIGSEKHLHEYVKTINDFVYSVVNERKQHLDDNASDLLSLFIQDAKKRGETLSDEYLRDVILNFMIAGRDTTACGLTYLFYLLSEHPDIENQLFDELHTQLQHQHNITQESLKNLILLEACFLESVRLFPPVAGDNKECIKDCTFPCGSRIPAGSVIAYSPYCLNRLHEYWSDAEDFIPNRWIQHDDENNTDKIIQPSAFVYPSFNAGFRLCLGKPMALMEAKVVASAILSKFSLRMVPGHDTSYRVSVVLSMKNGLKMTVRRREDHV